jgi:hypothetical protein
MLVLLQQQNRLVVSEFPSFQKPKLTLLRIPLLSIAAKTDEFCEPNSN